MAFKVIFSPTSIRDPADSVRYIARRNTAAAEKLGCQLNDQAERIVGQQPRIGPKCPEFGDENRRYLLHRGYGIVYQMNEFEMCIEVLRFWH